jgi:hypothetical protein
MVKPLGKDPKDRPEKEGAVDPTKGAELKGSGHHPHEDDEPMAADPDRGADVEGSREA